MARLFSACPYGFWSGWEGFVLSQFRTRYCGHTLSRLAVIRHNKTKQTRFPTVRRERSLERAGLGILFWPSRGFLDFFDTGGTCMKVEINWVCLLCLFDGGRLARPVPNQWRVSVIYRACWFGIDLATKLRWREKPSTHAFCGCCLQEQKGCGPLADGQAWCN